MSGFILFPKMFLILFYFLSAILFLEVIADKKGLIGFLFQKYFGFCLL